MDGKFSAQLQQLKAQQQQPRLTRTQRLLSQSEERQARERFEALRQQAQQKKEEFANMTFEQYQAEYSKLSPELQQFFLSPQELQSQRTAEIQNEQSKLNTWIASQQSLLERKRQELKDYQAWWDSQSSQDKNRGDARKNFEAGYRDRERQIEEVDDRISLMQENAGKIQEGTLASSIRDYAEEKASYNRSVREGTRKASEEFQRQLATGELDKQLVQLGLNKTYATYQDYVKEAGKYNVDVAYRNQIIAWTKSIGYKELPAFAQKIINPSAVAWQEAHPTEVLQFDKAGNVVGVEKKPVTPPEHILAEYTPPQVPKEAQIRKNVAEWISEKWAKVKTGVTDWEHYGTAKQILETFEYLTFIKGMKYIAGKGTEAFGKQWKWLGESEWAKKEFNIPITLGGYGTADFEKSIDKQLQKVADIRLQLEQDVEKPFAERSQRMFESLGYGQKVQAKFDEQYLAKIEKQEITGEKAISEFMTSPAYLGLIEEYTKTPEYSTLAKQFQTELNYQTPFKLVEKEYFWKGLSAITPSTRGEAIKTAEVLGLVYVGGKYVLKPVLQATTKVPSAIWTGLSAGVLAWEGSKIRDPTLPKEERLLAIAYTSMAGLHLISKVPFVQRGYYWSKAKLSSLNLRLTEPDTIYLQRTGKLGTNVYYRKGRWIYSFRETGGKFKSVSIQQITKAKIKFDIGGEQLFGKYIPAERTYTEMIESTTKPISKREYRLGLKRLQDITKGKRVTGVTASYTDLTKNTMIVEPQFSKAGAFRTERELYDLYFAGTIDVPAKQKFGIQRTLFERLFKGKPLTRLLQGKPLLLKPTEIRIANLKRAYGGYIGLGDYDPSKSLVTFTTATGKLEYATGFKLDKVTRQMLVKLQGLRGAKRTKELANLLRIAGSKGRTILPSAETWLGEAGEQQVVIASRFKGAEGTVLTPVSKGYYAPFRDKWTYWKIQRSVPSLVTAIEKDLGVKWTQQVMAGGIQKTAFRNVPVQKVWEFLTTTAKTTPLRELSTIKVSTAVSRGLIEQPKPVFPRKMSLYDKILRKIATGREIYIATEEMKFPVLSAGIDIKPERVSQIKKIVSSYGISHVSGYSLASQLASYSAFIPKSYPTSQLSKPSSIPSIPSYPSFPSIKSLISMPSFPSIPSIPSVPSIPSFPSIPSIPSVPHIPSKPYYAISRIKQGELLKQKIRKRIKLAPEILGLMPDFTARALGLSPKEMSVKGAMAEIKRLQTGFEIRKGVRIKGFKNIQEKNLLKGIMA